MIVADTDVLIDALAGRDPGADRVERELGSGALATTSVTVFELRSGASTSSARRQIDRLLAPMEIFPFDRDAAAAASRARRRLEAGGEPIGMADYLIAGICLSRSASLLTRNRAHFDRIEGLSLAPTGA